MPSASRRGFEKTAKFNGLNQPIEKESSPESNPFSTASKVDFIPPFAYYGRHLPIKESDESKLNSGPIVQW